MPQVHTQVRKSVSQGMTSLKNKYKNFITIIIPRHIDRTNHIVESIKKLELKVHLHSSKTKVNPNTDIYLVNAYGMTKSFFQICNTVFLGGSIMRHGGQNPLEPSRYGCNVLHGPNVWNFKEIYSLLNKYNVSSKVNSINQIANKVDNIFVKKPTAIFMTVCYYCNNNRRS